MKEYSVQRYIDDSVADGDVTDAEKDLMKAMKGYGYHSQRYLSGLRGFAIGSDCVRSAIRMRLPTTPLA